MAITTIGIANDVIGPSQFSDMMTGSLYRVRFDGPDDCRPSWSSNRVVVQPGAVSVAGVRVRLTSAETLTVSAPSSGTRVHLVMLSVRWDGETALRSVYSDGGSGNFTINSGSSAASSQVNRIPGVQYDIPICKIFRTSTSARVEDQRMWGGDGGPLRVTPQLLADPYYVDVRRGSMIQTDRGLETKRLDDDGVWRGVGTLSNPWRTWIPMMRYYGDTQINGTSGGTVAGMGNGSQVSARYRIVDGLLDGYVHISPGATGATWGTGGLTIDLPHPCAGWQEDTWSMGHLYTRGYGSDGNFDWHAEGLIKRGWTRCMLWAPVSQSNNRLEPMRASAGTQPQAGTGVPFVAGGFPVGDITLHLSYPVDV